MGRTEHNRLYKQYYGVHRLLLHAWRLAFAHPVTGERVEVSAPLDAEFAGLLQRFEWTLEGAPRSGEGAAAETTAA